MKRSWEGPKISAVDSFDEEPLSKTSLSKSSITAYKRTYKKPILCKYNRIGASSHESSTRDQHATNTFTASEEGVVVDEELSYKNNRPSEKSGHSQEISQCTVCEGKKKSCNYQGCRHKLCRCKTHGSCEECGEWNECSACGKNSENGIECKSCGTWIHWWCIKVKACLAYPDHRFCTSCSKACTKCKVGKLVLFLI